MLTLVKRLLAGVLTLVVLGSSQWAHAVSGQGLVVSAEMQISDSASIAPLESHTVKVLLRSCDERPFQLSRFKDGANELAGFPNVAAAGCIALDKSSVPFESIRSGLWGKSFDRDSIEKQYQLIGIDAYFDTTHRKPEINLADCVVPPSQVLINKNNPRESYAHCAPDHNASEKRGPFIAGLVIDSPANLYLLLFKYRGKEKAAGLPEVTLIVGLVD